jgi:hypothetical protein
MQGMGPAERTEFLKGQFVRGPLLVFGSRIVLALALITSKAYQVPHSLSFEGAY